MGQMLLILVVAGRKSQMGRRAVTLLVLVNMFTLSQFLIRWETWAMSPCTMVEVVYIF